MAASEEESTWPQNATLSGFARDWAWHVARCHSGMRNMMGFGLGTSTQALRYSRSILDFQERQSTYMEEHDNFALFKDAFPTACH